MQMAFDSNHNYTRTGHINSTEGKKSVNDTACNFGAAYVCYLDIPHSLALAGMQVPTGYDLTQRQQC